TLVSCMVFDEVLLLPKPCSTRKAPRRSDGRNPRGTCTTPESLRPADGMVTASSVIGRASVRARWRLYRNGAGVEAGLLGVAAPVTRWSGRGKRHTWTGESAEQKCTGVRTSLCSPSGCPPLGSRAVFRPRRLVRADVSHFDVLASALGEACPISLDPVPVHEPV